MDTPLTIIVVEDNPVDIYLIRWVLRAHELSYALEVIENGDRAMDYVNQLTHEERRREAPCLRACPSPGDHCPAGIYSHGPPAGSHPTGQIQHALTPTGAGVEDPLSLMQVEGLHHGGTGLLDSRERSYPLEEALEVSGIPALVDPTELCDVP